MADRYILTDDPSRAAALASLLAGQVIDPLTGTGWTETEDASTTATWATTPARDRKSVV